MAKKRNNGIKLNEALVLNQYMLNLFGVTSLEALSADMKESIYEGYDENNVSKFYDFLVTKLFHNKIINKDLLLAYDQNIYTHTRKISEKRDLDISWKYFQYLSLLFTEVYLDKYFSDPHDLLNDINEFVDAYNMGELARHRNIPIHNPAAFVAERFTLNDLTKLAFWNATGSGKTLLMHVNILQYLHYLKKHKKERTLNRIILLTPNEGLSKQHLKEFEQSNLSAELFNKDGRTLFSGHSIEIIDIHKLEDQAGDKTVAVDSFEGNNLVLVDEGHRGSTGEDWKAKRDKLSESGFSFEYSATFGQAVKAGSGKKKTRLLQEYAKCTLFDYSYKYFYSDGYGKDYRILNISDTSHETYTEKYLTACLLTFYQQLIIHQENRRELSRFLIDKPLWIFVGGKVTAVRKENKKDVSDVVEILLFLSGFVKNERKSISYIELLLDGRHGLVDGNNQNIFSNSFTYLLNKNLTAEQIYHNVLKLLFNSDISGAQLHLDDLKGAEGEIGIRVGNADYFGVVNVGDVSKLMSLCADNKLSTSDREFSGSLFHGINDKDSSINILIGSKKFTEGWSSWRVSTMGLMNIGRGEGSEIIQLFGRGVRLKGYEHSLKRSDGLDQYLKPDHIPAYLKQLETLNIFGIRSDYMQQFKEYLEEEGLPPNDSPYITVKVPVLPTINLNGKKLKIVQVDDGANFKKDVVFHLPLPTKLKQKFTVTLDWYPKVQIRESRKNKASLGINSLEEGKLEQKHLAFLNWDEVYFELQKFKNERSWYNLNISKTSLQDIIRDTNWYTLFIPQDELELDSFEKVITFQEITTSLLKAYCDKAYNQEKSKYMSNHLKVTVLTPDHPNFISEYQFQVQQDQIDIINKLKRLSLQMANNEFKNVCRIGLDFDAFEFARHMYKPLVWLSNSRYSDLVRVTPVELNKGEKDFVDDLKRCYQNPESIVRDKEIFLLRNTSRKGVGFFEANNFYPDFILWILDGEKQFIAFVDPHGLRQMEGFTDAKIQFYKTVTTEIEPQLNDPEISLSSFIISPTPYEQVKHWKGQDRMEDFWNYNVCFQREEREWYVEKIIKRAVVGA